MGGVHFVEAAVVTNISSLEACGACKSFDVCVPEPHIVIRLNEELRAYKHTLPPIIHPLINSTERLRSRQRYSWRKNTHNFLTGIFRLKTMAGGKWSFACRAYNTEK